jgi:hypothetical protein
MSHVLSLLCALAPRDEESDSPLQFMAEDEEPKPLVLPILKLYRPRR